MKLLTKWHRIKREKKQTSHFLNSNVQLHTLSEEYSKDKMANYSIGARKNTK
jgi:hypothetical protein